MSVSAYGSLSYLKDGCCEKEEVSREDMQDAQELEQDWDSQEFAIGTVPIYIYMHKLLECDWLKTVYSSIIQCNYICNCTGN